MSVLGTRVSDETVRYQLLAHAEWDRDANLRDVLDRKDLLAQPALVASLLAERLSSGTPATAPMSCSYPKDDGTYRTTWVLDPFDELRYSLLASAVAPRVNATLPNDRIVLSTRFIEFGRRVYGAEGWRTARRRQGSVVTRTGPHPVGGIDVERQYETCPLSGIETALNSCGVDGWLVDETMAMLQELAAWPATAGILVGPMGSAMFGTLSLLSLDRLLARLQVLYERWGDDVTASTQNERHFTEIVTAVSDLLAPAQRLNASKTWFGETADHAPSGTEFGKPQEPVSAMRGYTGDPSELSRRRAPNHPDNIRAGHRPEVPVQ
ncbi:MAG TPA: hypothetical protein VGC47_04015 [Acidimicrobiia bacterium]